MSGDYSISERAQRRGELMKNAYPWLLAVALVLAFGGAVAGQTARPARDSDVRLAAAPPSVAARRNPYGGQPEAVLAGQKLFKRYCAECHGPEGRGQDKAPNLHSTTIQNASPGALFWFLKNGNLRKGMPSWSRLPDQRLWQLVSYLRSLR